MGGLEAITTALIAAGVGPGATAASTAAAGTAVQIWKNIGAQSAAGKARRPPAEATASAALPPPTTQRAGESAPSPDAARECLAQVLVNARLAAGKPTLAELAAHTDYSESMLSRVFSGKALPSNALLRGLAALWNIDRNVFHTLWVPLWREAQRGGRSLPAPAAPPEAATPTGFECPNCGSWVVNAAKHMEWHTEMENKPAQTGVTRPFRSVS